MFDLFLKRCLTLGSNHVIISCVTTYTDLVPYLSHSLSQDNQEYKIFVSLFLHHRRSTITYENQFQSKSSLLAVCEKLGVHQLHCYNSNFS